MTLCILAMLIWNMGAPFIRAVDQVMDMDTQELVEDVYDESEKENQKEYVIDNQPLKWSIGEEQSPTKDVRFILTLIHQRIPTPPPQLV